MSEKTKFWMLAVLLALSIGLLVYLFQATQNAPL